MSTYLDIIGSVIIAGMLLLNFAAFMGSKQDSEIEATNTVVRQQNIRDLVQTMQYDFRKIGYGCDTNKIIKCSSTGLCFRGDLENDGKLDTVMYYYGIKGVAFSATDKNKIHRIVNGRADNNEGLPLEKFAVTYLDKNGAATSIAKDVKDVRVAMWVRDILPVEGKYETRKIEFKVTPKNLN